MLEVQNPLIPEITAGPRSAELPSIVAKAKVVGQRFLNILGFAQRVLGESCKVKSISKNQKFMAI